MEHFKSDGKFVYLLDDHAEFNIPKKYFDMKFAENRGKIISSIGMFPINFYTGSELTEQRILKIPTDVEFFAYDTEDRYVTFTDADFTDFCTTIHYDKGQKIMNDSIVQNSSNAAAFIELIIKGKVPEFIPYDVAIDMWDKNLELNNTSLDVPSVIRELILSVAYRSKKDPAFTFRQVIGKDPEGTSQYGYVMSNVRQICQYASTFTGMTFEDIDSMITTSVNRTKHNGNEAYSPIEDLLKQ